MIAFDTLFDARVPKRFIVEFGTTCLDQLLATPEEPRRVVSVDERGELVVRDCVGPIQFIEAAHAAGLEPWPADPGEPIAFWNGVGPETVDGVAEYLTEPAAEARKLAEEC